MAMEDSRIHQAGSRTNIKPKSDQWPAQSSCISQPCSEAGKGSDLPTSPPPFHSFTRLETTTVTNSEHQSRPYQITKHKSKEEKGTHLGRRNNGGPLLVALLRRRLWLRRFSLFHGRGKARVALDYAGAWRDIGFSNRRLRPVLCGRLASRWGSGAVRTQRKRRDLARVFLPAPPFPSGCRLFP